MDKYCFITQPQFENPNFIESFYSDLVWLFNKWQYEYNFDVNYISELQGKIAYCKFEIKTNYCQHGRQIGETLTKMSNFIKENYGK